MGRCRDSDEDEYWYSSSEEDEYDYFIETDIEEGRAAEEDEIEPGPLR